ncbi:MAG: NADH:ubiquinone reductase (Na(+)-transporting) subunit C [Bacteroidia bacterium]|nr:MAG: NADH:ubiquinone reductase (Na(+)-transporting) subunit C [Bacteroidia bacterium]
MTNRYVFLYASAMVVVVALVLSSAATLLRPLQERNMRIEKMQNILAAINIPAPRAEAEALFNQYITTAKIVNSRGEEIEGDAFEVELQDEVRKDLADRQLPVFIADVDGEIFYILPIRGNGLWGPIWGYIGLESDLTTIAGANFDHASETPGLGAEIADKPFQEQFTGKRIFDEEGNFRPVRVVKGRAPADDLHAVDGVSGGTITSNGVTNMVRDGLAAYKSYFEKIKTT